MPIFKRYSLPLIAVCATAAVTAMTPGEAMAQTEDECRQAILALVATLDEAKGMRESLREEVHAAAQSQPLILAMADGTYVNLSGEAALSEPFESWFVNEDVIARKAAAQEAAEQAESIGDLEGCLSSTAE